MCTFAKHMILCHSNMSMTTTHNTRQQQPSICSSHDEEKPSSMPRRSSIFLAAAAATAMLDAIRRPPPIAHAEAWGTRSFIREKYFQPQLSPEDAVARIRQTTEGLKEMRHMLDTMSWRYVLFYIRLKSAYLDTDLKNAMSTVPESQRKSYIKAANEVVDYMTELDRHVRSPKVYESYVYYEKTLKSLDELVEMLA